jgi:hypothetical protein
VILCDSIKHINELADILQLKEKIMITKEQLEKLNKLKCSEHGDQPKAKYIGEDINFVFCCENFNQEIRNFVKESTSSNIQELTRKSFGI